MDICQFVKDQLSLCSTTNQQCLKTFVRTGLVHHIHEDPGLSYEQNSADVQCCESFVLLVDKDFILLFQETIFLLSYFLTMSMSAISVKKQGTI